jgi:hypothetical protein
MVKKINDPFGFTKAINNKVIDNMDMTKLEDVLDLLNGNATKEQKDKMNAKKISKKSWVIGKHQDLAFKV